VVVGAVRPVKGLLEISVIVIRREAMENLTMNYQDGLDFGVGVNSASGGRRQFGAAGAPETMHGSLTGGDGSFNLVEIKDTHDLETHLGISAEASGGAGLFSASAKFNFTKDAKIQSNSTVLLMTCSKSFGFMQILKPVLDPDAAKLVEHPEAFAERYGDYFVAGVESGGQFFGIIKIEYASEAEKTSISASLSGSYGLFSADVAMNLSNAVKNTHSEVSSSLYYQGGNVETAVHTPDDLFKAKEEWERSVLGSAKPYAVLLMPWATASGPEPPNAVDLQNQKDVLVACAELRSQVIDRLNTLEYILDGKSSKYFKMQQGDADRISKLHANVSLDLDIIKDAASYALDNAKLAVEPETYARTIKKIPDYSITVPTELPVLLEGNVDPMAQAGFSLVQKDPLALEIRALLPEGPTQRGFDLLYGLAPGQSLPGPGKDKFENLLPAAEERRGFEVAEAYMLPRNRYFDNAAAGLLVANANPIVKQARESESVGLFTLGFDIATGIFGDPKQGGKGNTSSGPGAERIRSDLPGDAQRGFDASRSLNLGPPLLRS
jgi:hypothetical protein